MTKLSVCVKLKNMKPRAALDILAPLLKGPYFTSSEAKKVGVSSALLSHYVKINILRRIRRGVYQKTDYWRNHTSQWADLIELIYSISGGVICLISALVIYNLTEEMPRQHWIAIRNDTSVKTRKGVKIIRYRNVHLGKTEIELEGTKVPIFDRERTIIDAFRLLSRETAIKALKTALAKGGKNRIDLIKLQEYAKKLRFNISPYLLSLTT